MGFAETMMGGFLGRMIFRQGAISALESLTPHFIRMVIAGEPLREAKWSPGDKLQVYIADAGTRCYTPMRWDAVNGETELLIYAHGDTPGVRWARTATVGQKLHLFGPRGSLPISEASRTFVFGDETSLALVQTQGASGAAVLEVADSKETQTVLEKLGVKQSVTLIERQPGDAHHGELVAAVAEARTAHGDARLFLSGRAAAIQAVRQGLKQRGIPLGDSKAKAYWAPGKVGMD